VNFERQDNLEVLEVKIELPESWASLCKVHLSLPRNIAIFKGFLTKALKIFNHLLYHSH
jgi:hypothetical protein